MSQDFEIRANQGQAQGAGFVPDEPEGDEKTKKAKAQPNTSIYIEGKALKQFKQDPNTMALPIPPSIGMKSGELGIAGEIPFVKGDKGNVGAYYKFGVGNIVGAEAGINGELQLYDHSHGYEGEGPKAVLTGSAGVYGNVSLNQKYNSDLNVNHADEYQATAVSNIDPQTEMDEGFAYDDEGNLIEHEVIVTEYPGASAFAHAQANGELNSNINMNVPTNNFGVYARGGIKGTYVFYNDNELSLSLGVDVSQEGAFVPYANVDMAPPEYNASAASSAGQSQAESYAEAGVNLNMTTDAGVKKVYDKTKVGGYIGVEAKGKNVSGEIDVSPRGIKGTVKYNLHGKK